MIFLHETQKKRLREQHREREGKKRLYNANNFIKKPCETLENIVAFCHGKKS